MRQSAPHLRPDAFTFGSMFKAHDNWCPRLSTKQRRRNRRLGRGFGRKTTPPVPVRELFRELMHFHALWTQAEIARGHRTITRGVLNVALRVFVKREDYAAALITLQTFATSGVRLNKRTCEIIIFGLYRIAKDECIARRRDRSMISWSERFLAQRRGLAPSVRMLQSMTLWFREKMRRVYQVRPRPATTTTTDGMEEVRAREEVVIDVELLEDLLRRGVLAKEDLSILADKEKQEETFEGVMRIAREKMLGIQGDEDDLLPLEGEKS